MSRDWLKFLQDILNSIDMIDSYLTGIKSFSDYKSNFMLIDAIERRLSIIGEAMGKMSQLNPEIKVTDHKKIIGLRNILTHDYDLIDDGSICWLIIQKKSKSIKRRFTEIYP